MLHVRGKLDRPKHNVVPTSPILVILKMEALRSSKTSVLTRATRSQKTTFFVVTAVKTSNLTIGVTFEVN
jgi:hypothetical protein